jgi:hypothetical protein
VQLYGSDGALVVHMVDLTAMPNARNPAVVRERQALAFGIPCRTICVAIELVLGVVLAVGCQSVTGIESEKVSTGRPIAEVAVRFSPSLFESPSPDLPHFELYDETYLYLRSQVDPVPRDWIVTESQHTASPEGVFVFGPVFAHPNLVHKHAQRVENGGYVCVVALALPNHQVPTGAARPIAVSTCGEVDSVAPELAASDSILTTTVDVTLDTPVVGAVYTRANALSVLGSYLSK